jgi:hypothetical protein
MTQRLARTLPWLLLALLIAVPVLPAAAQTLTPGRTLPGDATVTAAAGVQISPVISQGGDVALVVWSDGRANTTNTSGLETAYDICGMRFDATGAPLDATPIAIAAAPADQTNPRVAWNGANWLVLFESYSISGTGGYYENSLAFVRVSAAGQKLDGNGVDISVLSYPDAYTTIDLAWDGSQWKVTWGHSGALRLARISAAGQVLAPRASWSPTRPWPSLPPPSAAATASACWLLR